MALKGIASLAAALAVLALPSCSSSSTLGTATVEECVSKYAVPAGTDAAVRGAATMCRVLFSDTDKDRKDWARCLLPKLAEVRTNVGVQAAAETCRRELGRTEPASAIVDPYQQTTAQAEHGPWEDYQHR